MINYLILLSLIFILVILIYLLFSIKNKETSDKGGNNNIQNKLNEVSNDIHKIEQSQENPATAFGSPKFHFSRKYTLDCRKKQKKAPGHRTRPNGRPKSRLCAKVR